ncbi:MAG: prephenate dehydratase [Thermodesulfobacteriota bacterium]|jgi:chorismate mutase/prephenate dehydratase|nr:MAG: prephenate dehydratase [Thermodesulfobacteriota bacterium]
MDFDKHLKDLRKKINQTDEQILNLISARARFAKEIGMFKKKYKIEPYSANREKIIHQRLEKLNHGPLSNENVRIIFGEIISACLSLEKSLKIAYLGSEATFSHQAALQQFGHSPRFIPLPTIEGVFREVEKKQCDYGVVPIENSTEGSIFRTLDMFIVTPLKICAEISLEVSLYLLSSRNRIEDIKTIYSHPQALAQCSRWLAHHLPDIPVKEASSTAQAAKKAKEDSSVGAVAGKLAAKIYDLKILKNKIEDYPKNFTRFWVISHQSPEKSGQDKTSIMFCIKHKAGSLHKIIYPFAHYGISMTKIESRPLKDSPWEYFFFVDLEGHVTDPKLKKALNEIEKMVNFLKVLGSYPRSR